MSIDELHYTTKTAPQRLAELGRTGRNGAALTISAVRSLARAHSIGSKVGRDWLFTEADLIQIAALPGPGNPNWTQKSGDDAPPVPDSAPD